jgi:cytochrome o ubiquinol oxidase subunit 3
MAETANQTGSDSAGSGITLWAYDYDDHDEIGNRSFGFWLYMMSDLLVFTGLFVAHRQYTHAFAGSLTASQISAPLSGLLPSALILLSVLAYGFSMVSLKSANRKAVLRWMGVAFVLGLAFIGVESYTFAGLAARGAIPSQSGFLSDYWTIIWAHGLHVTFALLWTAVMLIQVTKRGFTELVVARLVNLRIFWFFQAAIWVCVYTVMYLLGSF